MFFLNCENKEKKKGMKEKSSVHPCDFFFFQLISDPESKVKFKGLGFLQTINSILFCA